MDLRHELKAWEKDFAGLHGRKPDKRDIRRDPGIAAKYRAYDQSRRVSIQHVTPSKKRATPPRISPKASGSPEVQRSPQVAQETPRSIRLAPTPQAIRHGTPGSAHGPTPQAVRLNLGPTPQRNGQILGLFDLDTPQKTPSHASPGKTPTSSGKRFMLDTYAATPIKRSLEIDATPAFLRRTEDEGPVFKKRGLARSLSGILQGLRKQEDAQVEENWGLLDEMEDMPLGPDQDQDELDGDDDGGTAIPGKVWKKKGLKRQTKQTKMLPRPRPAPLIDVASASKSPDEDDDTDDIEKEIDPDNDSESDDRPDGKLEKKKPARKVNELAHANFCRLKIKGKGPKPARSRFGGRKH